MMLAPLFDVLLFSLKMRELKHDVSIEFAKSKSYVVRNPIQTQAASFLKHLPSV